MSKQNSRFGLFQVIGAGVAVYLLYQFFDKDESGGTSHDVDDDDINTGNLSYQRHTYKAFADAIEAAVWGTGAFPAMTEDDAAIGQILMQMQNIDDVYALMDAYGVRGVGIVLQDRGNLVETIQRYLDADVKRDVNTAYQQRGINFAWL